MTVSSQITSITIPGNGVQTAFAYNFAIPSASDGSALVNVLVVNADGSNTTLSPGTFTITGLNNPSGGVVVYPLSGAPLQVGQNLVIQRGVPYTQNTSVTNQAFYPRTLEQVADWLTYQTQQLAEVDSRALQFLPGDTGLGYLPPASLRKGLVLGFDAITGAPIAVTGGSGGGGSSAWSALTGVPQVIQAMAAQTAANGQIIEFTGPTTAHMISTPSFTQNFNYSALSGVPGQVAALTTGGVASAGKIFEYLTATTGHFIATPGGGGGGITGPGSSTNNALVKWTSAGGVSVGDTAVVPSANGYSLISAVNYAAMRGLLGIGNVGLQADLSTLLLAGTGLTAATVAGVTTITYTGSGGGITTSTYVGTTTGADFTVASQTITFPAGTNTGDLAVILCGGQTSQPITPSGWTTVFSGAAAFGSFALIAFKVLTNADVVAGGVNVTGFAGNSKQIVAVWRGPTNVSIGVSSAAASPSTLNFNKNAANIGTVSLYSDHTVTTITGRPGAPFTNRLTATGALWQFAMVDALAPGSPYVDGTNETWTWSSFQSNVWMLELRNDGVTSAGVNSVNARTGAVLLTAADVATNFGSQMNTKIAAGTGVTTSYNAGTDTLTINAPGGGAGVTSFNGRTGGVTLGAADLTGMITAGAGISVNYTGATYQIINTGSSGGVPIGYNGAAENSITPANTATTNTTNLNNLISTINAAGGGKIWFNGPGPYQINGTIHSLSNVDIEMVDGAYFSWQGAAGGTCFDSPSTDVLYAAKHTININEGGAFTGIVFNYHSFQNVDLNLTALGTQTAAGTFTQLFADSSAGLSPYPGNAANRNSAFSRISLKHLGTCGYGLLIQGITSGYSGAPQVLTDITFHDCQFANVLFRGIKINQWADTFTFQGHTYIGLNGLNSIGVVINEGRVNNYSVYNITFQDLAIDTFSTGLNRNGVVLFESKTIKIDQYFQDPTAENGPFLNTAGASYLYNICVAGTNNMVQHYLGWSSTTP
jgi:hypothetical protein